MQGRKKCVRVKDREASAESPAYAQSFGYVCVQGRAWAITEFDELYLKEMPPEG